MLLGLRSLWESGVIPPPTPTPVPVPVEEASNYGWSLPAVGGRPVPYIAPRKKKSPWPGEEIEEEEVEEILAMLGIEI